MASVVVGDEVIIRQKRDQVNDKLGLKKIV